MSSSPIISLTSTPFTHCIASTSASRLSNETTFIAKSNKISHLIADFIGPLPLGASQHAVRVVKIYQANDNKVVKEKYQVGLNKNLQEGMSELIRCARIANDVLQTGARGENGNQLKIKQNLFTRVFELIDHQIIRSIIMQECNFMARVALKSMAKTPPKQLYIIASFIKRLWPLVNITFQSKDYLNVSELFNFLSMTPLLEEHQLWRSFTKDYLNNSQFGNDTKNLTVLRSQNSKDRKVFDQDYFDDNLLDDKCSTASRSSINTHERNFEINDIDSGNVLEFSLNLRFNEVQSPPRSSLHNKILPDSQPSFSEFFACAAYEGCFVGDLDISFSPFDNLLSCYEDDQSKAKSTRSKCAQKRQSQNAHHRHHDFNQSPHVAQNKINISKFQTADQSQQQPLPNLHSKNSTNNKKILEFKPFTLPNLNCFEQNNDKAKSKGITQKNKNLQKNLVVANGESKAKIASFAGGTKNTQDASFSYDKTQNTRNQKPKSKRPQDKGIKLWDMISVNGKLKKN